MKIYKSALLGASILAFAGCQEFDPVLTFKYENPKVDIEVEGSNVVADGEIVANTTIAELAALYTQGNPFIIEDDIIIEGRVISNDRPGNFYNEIFIQDETGGISIKIGKNSLYNTYKPGQKVYVKCGPTASSKGLTLGCYGYKTGDYGGNGMVQLGSEFFKGTYNVEYETNYIRSQHVIDQHVFRGSPEDIVEQVPVVIEEKDLPSKNATLATCPYLGRLVTLKGLKYGGEAFALLYLSGNESNKNSNNRVFLSDKPWDITTWAMSKTNFLRHLQNGDWDDASVGNSGDSSYGTVGAVNMTYLQEKDAPYYENLGSDEAFRRQVFYYVYGEYPAEGDERYTVDNLRSKWVRYQLAKNANSYSVSQYFKMGSTEIQLRTSGYSRFADLEIPEEVLNGTATVDLTGVLSLYQGSIQFTVNEIKLTDGKYTEGDVIVNY